MDLSVLMCDCLFENVKAAPFIVLKNGERIAPEYTFSFNENAGTAMLVAENSEFCDSLYFSHDGNAVICKRIFENRSDKTLDLCELGVSVNGISFNSSARDDYFYHNENPRIYEVMTFPIDYKRTAGDAKDSDFDFQAGNRWADPGVISDRIGASPYQPFPAILLSNYNVNRGIVHGTLSQKVFFHNYLVKHEEDAVTLEIFSSFKAIDALAAESGRVLNDEWYLGVTNEADNIEKIFDDYTRVLRKKLPVSYGRSDANRNCLVWGSWNDGIFRDVSEELLLTEARFLKENFPTVKWMQLDDGYSASSPDVAHGLGVPYEGDEGIDYNKFPNGIRHFTDEVKKIGLRPAIWIGGLCPTNTPIRKEKPEWFIDYSYRTHNFPLDMSQSEVREYVDYAISVLVSRYGFEGVKHDFWSYPYEDSNNLYLNKERSGYEYRRWWLELLRRYLPNDGYLQTGCDIVMGNPFLGEYFTNYRYGIDIAEGNWTNVKTCFLWGAACFATHTGDLFVPNSDSVGIFPGLSEREAMLCINYCIATHSMVEISGLLSRAEDEERIRILKKAVCNPNNGQDVYFADYDYRNHDGSLPEIMYFKTPHFSVEKNNSILPIRTVALFNMGEEITDKAINAEKLNLSDGNYILTDVWSGEQIPMSADAVFTLQPHESRLFAVSADEGVQIFDANFKINSAHIENDTITVTADYKTDNAEITLNKNVKEIMFNGSNVEFEVNGNTVVFNIPDKGELKIQL